MAQMNGKVAKKAVLPFEEKAQYDSNSLTSRVGFNK